MYLIWSFVLIFVSSPNDLNPMVWISQYTFYNYIYSNRSDSIKGIIKKF